MKIGKDKKLDPNSDEFDYEAWRESQNIKPSIEVSIAVKPPMEDEESEDEDEEPEEYQDFKKENGVRSVKEVLKNAKGKRI